MLQRFLLWTAAVALSNEGAVSPTRARSEAFIAGELHTAFLDNLL